MTMAFFSVIVMTAEQRKNMMNENILNEIESDCFHTILTENQVAALAADGSIFGSGLAINDLMLKPNISASGALAVFDNKGNLIQTGLNNISLLNVSDLIADCQPKRPPVPYSAATLELKWRSAKDTLNGQNFQL